MTRSGQLLASLFCALALSTAPGAQSPAVMSVVKAGRLLDPRSGKLLSPAAVRIENDRIKEVGAPAQVQAHAPADARVLDPGSATLLPGLIDAHSHLLLDVMVPPEAEIGRGYNGTFAPGARRAATTNAAEMLGWQDRIGTVEAGKFADLVAVAADPLEDIGELERVGFVMKAGQVIRNDLAAR